MERGDRLKNRIGETIPMKTMKWDRRPPKAWESAKASLVLLFSTRCYSCVDGANTFWPEATRRLAAAGIPTYGITAEREDTGRRFLAAYGIDMPVACYALRWEVPMFLCVSEDGIVRNVWAGNVGSRDGNERNVQEIVKECTRYNR
jgi:hypothetical protein